MGDNVLAGEKEQLKFSSCFCFGLTKISSIPNSQILSFLGVLGGYACWVHLKIPPDIFNHFEIHGHQTNLELP